jgi:glycosyltransferase involved in cell wall biosynthesis
MTDIDPSILILSGAQGDTRRYRTFHLYEQTRLLGLDSQLSHVTDRKLREKVESSGIVIIHRAPFNGQIAWLESEIHRKSGSLIQDLDDLLFDPSAFKFINSVDFADPIRTSLFQEEMRLNRKTLEACDFVLTSSEYLAEYVRQLGKPVRVHRNAFSIELLERSESAYTSRKLNPDKIVIGYASGTATHNEDFAQIKPVLQAILSHHPAVELWIIGPLDPGNDWGSLNNQLRRLKLVPWRKLPEIQAQFDINLAPLRINNPFGQSKSEIKYVEAALLRVPTIASPSDAFKYAISHADNGFLAGETHEWEQVLESLIEQPGLRTRVGERAYQDAKLHYHPLVRAHELVDTLKSMLGEKFDLPQDDLSTNQSQNKLLQSFWSSAELERSPTLIQRGLYTLRYRNLRTLLQQIWIYIRRMVSPLFPYRNPL